MSALQLPAISIEDCYRMVRENYPLIHQYGLTEMMSRYSFENAAMGYVPRISLSAQASYQSDAVAFPEEFNSLLKMAGIEMEGMPKDLYKVQLEISQTLWDGGYAKARREAIKAEQEVSKLTLDKDMDALKTRVNQMYFGILVMEANLKANSYMDTLMASNMRVVESAVKNGTATQSDVDRIKVEILSLRQRKVQLESTIRTYKDMLAIMIGRKIEDDEVFEKPRLQLVDLSRNRRTELMLFDAQIRQIESQKKMLDVAVMPKFALFAQGWYGRPGLNMFNDMMYDRLTWNGMAGITMKWDITGFYTRKNDRRKIELSQKSVAAQRDAFIWNTDIQQTQIQNEIDRMYSEGTHTLVGGLFILLALNALVYFGFECKLPFYILAVVSLVVYGIMVNFFRCPIRLFGQNTEKVVVAPADGKVVVVEEVDENDYFHDRRIMVSIFMSLVNVHANWYPVDGIVKQVSHQNGKFMKAWLPKASSDNERSTIIIETPEGVEIMTRQIAGAMARRIVTYASPGEDCYIDEHLGFIKFGSRVDVYLPLGTEILVKLGQTTTGNQTIIAKLK